MSKLPKKVNEEIKDTALKAFKNFKLFNSGSIFIPENFNLEIEYTSYKLAKKYSNYPNAILNGITVKFFPSDLDKFLKILNLCI